MPHTFTLAENIDLPALAAALGADAPATSTLERVWFDTFDWPLWKAGLVLEVDGGGAGLRAALRARDTHLAHWAQTVDAIPRTAETMPPGPWRRHLAPLLSDRALLPVASVRLVRQALVIRNQDDKTIAEVIVELPAGKIPAGVCGWVRVVPVRGYERQAAELAARLERFPGLVPSDGLPLAWCVGDGRIPGWSGTELSVPLESELPAAEGMKRMLRHLYGTMNLVEPWLVDAPDAEFLHDWRVALRRSRSVLKMARGVFPPRVLEQWRPALRELQQRTGELRDLDVFVLEFDDYRASIPAEYGDDLRPLLALLLSRRAAARRRVERYLGSAAHARFSERYAAFLAADTDRCATGEAPDANRPIAKVGAERIRRDHRRVIRRGRRIDAESPAEALHELRIACKELRYALELHADLLPGPALQSLVKRLKSLQQLLGEHQDAEAHALAMESFATTLAGSPPVPARCLMAVGLLAQGFKERQARLRGDFAERFAEFDSAGTRDALADVLGETGA